MADNVIVIRDLVKRFGDFTAVDGIDLTIKRGEIFGILGPNGAGKSTTINMLLSLLKPTEGKIIIDGIDISSNPEAAKKKLGLMTQETVVEGDLTARQNLELFAELYHVDRKEIPGRVEEALKEAELTAFADKRAQTFSGGMQRRLELVKSMIQRPDILVLDEPTTGLDIQNRTRMWVHIRELRKGGVTILLTTQYLEESDQLCDRIAIIDHGKIKAIGTPSELKRLAGSGRILDMTVEAGRVSEAGRILKSKFAIDASIVGDKIVAGVSNEKADKIAEIYKALTKAGINVLAIGVHLPTMDDVFIKLTGSGMRDATDDNAASRISKVWRR